MTWSDPIVDEVRRARDAYAARFNYDLRAIYRDLKEQEERNARKSTSTAEHTTRAEAHNNREREGGTSQQSGNLAKTTGKSRIID